MKQHVEMIFHVVALAHNVYALKYSADGIDFSKTTDPQVLDMQQFGYRYFTTWNMLMQVLYLCLALLYDIVKKHPKGNEVIGKKLKLWKGYIFTSFVFPFTLFVSMMFWSVYTINREWVLPEVTDAVIPGWLNHSLHTNILILLAVEIFLTNQLLPSFKSAFLGISIITLIYDVIFFSTYFQSGRWLYGLFYVLNWNERIMFMFFNYFATVLVMKLGIILQNKKRENKTGYSQHSFKLQ